MTDVTDLPNATEIAAELLDARAAAFRCIIRYGFVPDDVRERVRFAIALGRRYNCEAGAAVIR